jgi:hypothetical protein
VSLDSSPSPAQKETEPEREQPQRKPGENPHDGDWSITQKWTDDQRAEENVRGVGQLVEQELPLFRGQV